MNAQVIERLAHRWRWMITVRELCYAFAAGCIVSALLLPWSSWLIFGLVAAFGSVLALRLAVARPWRVNSDRLARQLDRLHPELEESSALWLRPPDSMTLLERLQCRRLDRRLVTLTAANPQMFFGAPGPAFCGRPC